MSLLSNFWMSAPQTFGGDTQTKPTERGCKPPLPQRAAFLLDRALVALLGRDKQLTRPVRTLRGHPQLLITTESDIRWHLYLASFVHGPTGRSGLSCEARRLI